MKLDEAIKTRKSVKKFNSEKKPDWRDILKAIDSARFAPFAGNMFNLKFILVKDKDKIKEIGKACQQPFVGTAPYILVVTGDDTQLKRSYGERGEMYARQQAGAAIQNVLLKLTELDIVTCWIGAFVEEQVKRTLKIPDNIKVEVVLPLGTGTKIKEGEKNETELENYLFFDQYWNKLMEPHTRISADAE